MRRPALGLEKAASDAGVAVGAGAAVGLPKALVRLGIFGGTGTAGASTISSSFDACATARALRIRFDGGFSLADYAIALPGN